MSTSIMVIVIVAIVVSGVVRLARIKAGTDYPRHIRHYDRYGHQQVGPSERELELQSEVTELRERVKVLERIATEEHKPQRLAAEIESLRDQ